MRPVPQKLSGLPNIASSEEIKRQELPGLHTIAISRQDTSLADDPPEPKTDMADQHSFPFLSGNCGDITVSEMASCGIKMVSRALHD